MNTNKLKVKREQDFTYTNKFNNKKINFSPKYDEMIVTFPYGLDTETVNLPREIGKVIAQDNAQGFAIIQVPDLDIETLNINIENNPYITNSLPAMIDDQGLKRYFLPDELTIQFKRDIEKQEAEKIIIEKGSKIITQQRTPGYYTISVPESKGLFETLRMFSDLDDIEFAEPSELSIDDYESLNIPEDPFFTNQWGLYNNGQNVNGEKGSSGADISVLEAWRFTKGKPNVIIVVIDSGIDYSHNDLKNNILDNDTEDWNFEETEDIKPVDKLGHGTLLCGIISAENNGIGIVGVAPQCKVMPLRISLRVCRNQNRVDAINYVVQYSSTTLNNRYIINCSWKISGDHAGIHNAIINAVANNIIVICSMGNDGTDNDIVPHYPSGYSEVISVGAIDQNDRKATFSNYGSEMDVCAPGVNIYSTYLNNQYKFDKGTSLAVPYVAGLAALIWSCNENLTNTHVRSLISNTAQNIDAKNPGYVGKLGKGRISASLAVYQAQQQLTLI